MPDAPHAPASEHSVARQEQRSLRVPAPHASTRGLFISFEGGDGAGKSTQMAMLREHLVQARSVSEDLVLTTREPGGTELGEQMRSLLLHGDHVDERAEALMYAADRAHHIATVVRPHLDRGGLVLADRYLDSSIAYQGAGRSLEASQVAALSLWATEGLLPHRTILLDLPPEALDERREASSLDRLEQAGFAFHDAVRKEFLALAAAEPDRFTVIDGALPREEVHRQVVEAVGEMLDLLDPTFEQVDPKRGPREER